MSFSLEEAKESNFPDVVRCMWDTYENPPQNLYYIFFPLNAVGASNREEAIQESIERLWKWHSNDPTSYWHAVIDKETGRIAGAALWRIYETNPYAQPSSGGEAYWHPAGGQREYANQVLAAHEAPRARMAQRPHLYLNIIYTHPDYQLQGVARMILEWGIAKAKEMDVEIWLDAWKLGRPVYPRFGFVEVDNHKTKPHTDDPDEAWKECEKNWNDLEEWVMWRPKDGAYVEGKSVRPWI